MDYALFINILINVSERKGKSSQPYGQPPDKDEEDIFSVGIYQRPTPFWEYDLSPPPAQKRITPAF
jgi:hypothetical protein